VLLRHGRQSPEWEAYEPLSRSGKKAAPHAVMPFKGINPAFMLEQAGVAHHQPIDLAWTDAPVFPIPERRVGSDIPPLWNVKKKNALYYNAMGRGDFTKLLMQVSALAVSDTAHARRINERFPDVLAWLRALSPPVYPRPIDRPLAEKGEAIYTRHCQKCHGTKEEYPNLLVETKVVGTDPAYAEYFLDHPGFNDWYNQSWYATSSRPSSAQPSLGYVAPPLDGVWATAPYLHNGSVPTLEDLLDSRRRPAYWRRSFDDKDYDFQKVGWAYTRENGSVDQQTYNTTLSGYGNQGHTYGDVLSTEEREALIEYLKTW
jgi:mono/diheme cytochrome c family protein